jgi:hypothetical protein
MLFVPGQSCEICGSRQVRLEKCRICGSSVCAHCMSAKEKLCLVCLEARCQVCKENLSSRACNVCGKLVCEDHGTRFGEATLCDACKSGEEQV